jgi:hypothetical protein
MQRFLPGVLIVIFISGCGTTPVNTETTREVVLQYLGGDVGTAGPFYKGGKKELDVLSPEDRRQAEALIDQGAALFLVFGANQTQSGASGANRVVLVHGGKIVGDFRASAKPSTPAP